MFKVLVADDNEFNRRFLGEVFPMFEGSCDTVNDGLEAVVAFKNSILNNIPYDLVLLDVKMPAINGLIVLDIIRMFEELKHIENGVKIILSTGSANANDPDYCTRNKCDGCLVKPYDVDCVKDILEKIGLL